MSYFRKKRIFVIGTLLCLFLLFAGCVGEKDTGNVQVYSDTEENKVAHEEKSLIGVLSFKDDTGDVMGFIDSKTGETYILGYHGGVTLQDKYGKDITKAMLPCGTVCDVTFYADTKKLITVTVNDDTVVITGQKKFSIDPVEKKAIYSGSSAQLWESASAYEGDKSMQIDEISTEDEVTLSILNGKLMSVILTKGHGYVRLLNQDTYIGGMVEIGYDVIVPVTSDMLVTVGEGDYTLRINKNGYSDSKKVHVVRDKENVVDLSNIAVPDGTVAFKVQPSDAKGVKIMVDDKELTAGTFTAVYGTYTFTVTAKGYKTAKGRFQIDKPSSVKTIHLQASETTESTTESTTEEKTTEKATSTDATTGSGGTTTGPGTTTEKMENEGKVTDNKMTILTPEGVGVYVDGDYAGESPVSVTKVVGVHTITLYKSGYFIKTYSITAIDNGEDMKLNYPALTKVGSSDKAD